ncbi:MAG: hypothetical protein IT271_03120 [Chitinophagales bacterium]|nr:hypothetical protein [Chitinophagales bacterium]
MQVNFGTKRESSAEAKLPSYVFFMDIRNELTGTYFYKKLYVYVFK